MGEGVDGDSLAPQPALGCRGLVIDVGQGGGAHVAVSAVVFGECVADRASELLAVRDRVASPPRAEQRVGDPREC